MRNATAMFSESEKKYLLSVARNSIEKAVSGQAREIHDKVPTKLREPYGAFVTLHLEGDLRGCIGYIESAGTLVETVQEAAEKAALHDYRFNPVTIDEIPRLEIEISVLTPLKLVSDTNEIEVGKHGLMIHLGHNRGLLLPQVAPEQGWDRETFLNQTARKAGLHSAAWKDPNARIFSFTAEVFSEGTVR
jgi:AmmeMemoRadiSam system protein A